MGENRFQACKLWWLRTGAVTLLYTTKIKQHTQRQLSWGPAASCTGLVSSSCQAAVWVLPLLTLAPGSTRPRFGWMGGRGADTCLSLPFLNFDFLNYPEK